MNVYDLFQQGGPLMWVILAASVVGVFFFFERLYTLQRGRVLPRPFVDRIRGMVSKGKAEGALLLCEENGSSIALMMAAALRAFLRGKYRQLRPGPRTHWQRAIPKNRGLTECVRPGQASWLLE